MELVYEWVLAQHMAAYGLERAALEADAAVSDSSEPRHGTVSLKRARLEPG